VPLRFDRNHYGLSDLNELNGLNGLHIIYVYRDMVCGRYSSGALVTANCGSML